MADVTTDSTRRLVSKKQTLDDAYAAPANFLEIDVVNPITHGVGNKRYTDYEVRMRVSRVTLVTGRGWEVWAEVQVWACLPHCLPVHTGGIRCNTLEVTDNSETGVTREEFISGKMYQYRITKHIKGI
ncbi:Sorting nexin-12 [Portunus trituberculatus]|uniref:Sorting nexin-12 n=1 Tax=Portunus trituberculatus TaxID=210409 RepID=A0A5B7EWX0_PORTR|nr:Sorting nexin-12 [Portunus trituberculatus]